MNIRQKINRLRLSKQDKAFQEAGITSEQGNLTALGRRVVLDKLFQDSTLQADIYTDVLAALDGEVEGKTKKK